MRCVPLANPYDDICRHYKSQHGGSLPVFQGSMYQRGYGIGNIISGLARHAIPLLKSSIVPLAKSGMKSIGNKAFNTGRQLVRQNAHHIADSALKSSGELIEGIIKKRPIRKTVQNIVKLRANELLKNGSETIRNRRAKLKRKHKPITSRNTKRRRDIFT